MAIRQKSVVVTTTGSDGSAEGTGYTEPICGKILAVHLDFSSGQAATTDTTITTTKAPVRTIHVETDSATDVWRQPRIPVHDTAETALTYDGTRPIVDTIPIADIVKVAVAQADNNETVTVTILYEE